MRITVGRVIGALVAVAASAPLLATASSAAGPVETLLVGSWHGRIGSFHSIQAAVDAAAPGDWIVIGPGDYHENPGGAVGISISTPDLHLRGLSRAGVVIDGTRPGAPRPCDPDARWQNPGPRGQGRDGILVTASGVTVDNLTVCNFLGYGRGRQIAFDGGSGSGTIGLGAYGASYVTTTSTFAGSDSNSVAQYGIYVSNTDGPGRIDHSLASNMANSALHIGACGDCRVTFDHDVAQHSVIGFTAINAGGRLQFESSSVIDNTEGIDLASEQDESAPPPQDGSCPPGVGGPLSAHPSLCTVIEGNRITANNDPNVPGARGGIVRFTGAGILVAGGRHDAVVANTVRGQGSYGIIIAAYPWLGSPVEPSDRCQGGIDLAPGRLCLFNAFGNLIAGNVLAGNGSFGNPTNGDLAEATLRQDPGNCFTANTAAGGATPTSSPAHLQVAPGACTKSSGGAAFGPLGLEVACATGLLGPCADGKVSGELNSFKALAAALHGDMTVLRGHSLANLRAVYPASHGATAPAPLRQPSMLRPCVGAPANAWC